jgi:putative membrane protein
MNGSDFMIALVTRSVALALGVALGAVSAHAQTPPRKPAAAAATATLNREDQRFVQEAGAGGLAEVELSKIAQKSENPEVKNFADRMVQDHSKANQELVTVASSLGVDVPKALDAEHQRLSQKLAGLHGKAFDEEYMRAMLDDHNKTVMLFQAEERSGQNPELKQFAQKALPILQTHQKMAQELSRKVTTASSR